MTTTNWQSDLLPPDDPNHIRTLECVRYQCPCDRPTPANMSPRRYGKVLWESE